MNPVKIQFEHAIYLNDENDGDLSNYINNLLAQIYEENGGNDLPVQAQKFMESEFARERLTEQFISRLANNPIKYIGFKSILIKVGDKKGNLTTQPKFEWKFSCFLYSLIYTCLNINSDKTFICHSEDNEIKFLKINEDLVKAYVR